MAETTALDWNLMRSFVATVRTGSLSGAARSLAISQPTLSRHVTELERQLGIALFERTGRGLAPTEAALALVPAAQAMADAADELARAAAGRGQQVEGTVRLTASEVVAARVLPPILAELREREPGIATVVVASDAVANLLRREADIAVRMMRPAQASLIARRIGTWPIGAYAHHSYLERRGRPRRPDDFATHDLVGFEHGDDIERGFRAQGAAIDPRRFALRTEHQLVYWEAIRAGLGIGFAARWLARQDAGIEAVMPELRIPPLTMWLAVHREIRGNRRIRLVYDFLAERLSDVVRTA
jgi:DNA-binding transcriptional LysR family regulator